MSSGLSELMYSVIICEIVAQYHRFSLCLTWFVTTQRKLIEVRLFVGNWVMLLSLAWTVRLKAPLGVFMKQVIIIYKIVSLLNIFLWRQIVQINRRVDDVRLFNITSVWKTQVWRTPQIMTTFKQPLSNEMPKHIDSHENVSKIIQVSTRCP